MNWKTTIVLLAVAAALLLYVNFYEKNQPGTSDVAKNATRVFALNPEEVNGLVITNHDLKVDLQRDAQRQWTMKSPYADRADQTLINELFSDLESARREDAFPVKADDKSKLKEYGLQDPRVRLQIVPKGSVKPTEVLFGNDTPVEGRTYLELAGQNTVYVVPDPLKKLLQKEVNAWARPPPDRPRRHAGDQGRRQESGGRDRTPARRRPLAAQQAAFRPRQRHQGQ